MQVAFTAPNSSIAILALHKWLRETQERLEVKGEACLGRTTAIVTSERPPQASSRDVQLCFLQCCTLSTVACEQEQQGLPSSLWKAPAEHKEQSEANIGHESYSGLVCFPGLGRSGDD